MSKPNEFNPRTQELIEYAAKRDISPQDIMFDIIEGKKEEPHPVLYAILQIVERRKKQLPTAKQWEGLTRLAKKYKGLWNEPIDLGLRGSMAKEMMPYLYPKLSSTSVDAKVDATIKVAHVKLSLDLGGEAPKFPEPTNDPIEDDNDDLGLH